jgi:hypothetical protein
MTMICVHLQELFDVCREHDLKIGGSDLIRVVCRQCGQQEVCPSTLVEAPADQTADGTVPPPRTSGSQRMTS